MQNFNWRLFTVFVILGVIGSLGLIPYELEMYDPAELPADVEELNQWTVVTVNLLSQAFLVAVSVFVGMLTLKRTGLRAPFIEAFAAKEKMPAVSGKWLGLAISITFVGSLIVLRLDKHIFMPQLNLSDSVDSSMTWWYGLLAMLYGGITEELLVRFFIMGVIVWLLAVIFRKQAGEIPPIFYYVAIFLAAIIFGIGHLPATAQLFGGLDSLLIVRTLLLNGLLGLWFGFLYYRKGLEYAIIAHMSADLFIHVLLAT